MGGHDGGHVHGGRAGKYKGNPKVALPLSKRFPQGIFLGENNADGLLDGPCSDCLPRAVSVLGLLGLKLLVVGWAVDGTGGREEENVVVKGGRQNAGG